MQKAPGRNKYLGLILANKYQNEIKEIDATSHVTFGG